MLHFLLTILLGLFRHESCLYINVVNAISAFRQERHLESKILHFAYFCMLRFVKYREIKIKKNMLMRPVTRELNNMFSWRSTDVSRICKTILCLNEQNKKNNVFLCYSGSGKSKVKKKTTLGFRQLRLQNDYLFL